MTHPIPTPPCWRGALWLFSLLIITALTACSDGKEGPTDEQLATEAAKEYYDALIFGRTETWLDGHRGAKSMSQDYRSQLLDNAAMFLAQQDSAHGGIERIEIGNWRKQYVGHDPIALLTLCFADSTSEEVAVPMVKEGEEWKMK